MGSQSDNLVPPDRTPQRGAGHTNHLIDSTSPYLLQHAHNPVDWHPWGSEALELARREQKPIFLSIGYSACHWCHVMERESFENPAIAALMNAHFISIKVDREERPDLDDLYMMATQIMSGSGGWPMSVWLTPDLEPFYAGTYFPPVDGFGRPGFPRLLQALADAWNDRRPNLIEQAHRIVDAIRTHADESAGAHEVPIEPAAWIQAAITRFADRFDDTHGGLGGAPKFPPHQALLLWLTLLSPAGQALGLSDEHLVLLRSMATKTLDGMMNGGIYDQVSGGFARYSTDDHWLVPHFEKMLYDNAQLALCYAVASVLLDNRNYARVARETLDFFMDEMSPRGARPTDSTPGAFYSSLDADSEGAEGRFYVWTLANIRAALPDPGDADLIIEHFGLTEAGNWHESPVDGGNVLAVARPIEELATARGVSTEALRTRVDHLRGIMAEYRSLRPHPGLDDKVLTSWNGMMVSALAICGRVLKEPPCLEAAHRLIGFLLTRHMESGQRLLRVSRHDVAHGDAFLDDHSCLLNGLMDLIDSTMPTSLPGTMARKRALELADILIRDFEDPVHGGFFYTSHRHDKLFARMKNATDNATPSANGVAIRALLRLARISGKEQYREAALRAVAAFAPHIQRNPDYFPTILLALAEDAHLPQERALGSLATAPDQPLPPSLSSPEPALLQLSVDELPPVAPGAKFEVTLRLTIAAGYHIQPERPANPEAFHTVTRIRGAVHVTVDEWRYPPPDPVHGNDGATGYAGTVVISARCSLPANAVPGRHLFRVTLLAQPCSESTCLPPERVTVEFPLVITS